MPKHHNNEEYGQRLVELYAQHATPEALVAAEAPKELKLAEAVAENERRFLSRSAFQVV